MSLYLESHPNIEYIKELILYPVFLQFIYYCQISSIIIKNTKYQLIHQVQLYSEDF